MTADDIAEQNAALVEDHLDRTWNEGSLDETLVSDEYVVHIDQPENKYTLDEMRDVVARAHRQFPDVQFEIRETVATDKLVAVQYHWRGTHEAEALGVEPTGTTLEVTGLAQFHVEDGRLTEAWYVENVADIRERLERAAE